MKQAIRTRLLAELGSGYAVAWGSARRDQAPPYVVLRQPAGTAEVQLAAVSGWRTAPVQVHAVGKSYTAAEELAEAILAALNGWRTTDVYGVFLAARRDAEQASDIDDGLFEQQLDFDVVYRVTP